MSKASENSVQPGDKVLFTLKERPIFHCPECQQTQNRTESMKRHDGNPFVVTHILNITNLELKCVKCHAVVTDTTPFLDYNILCQGEEDISIRTPYGRSDQGMIMVSKEELTKL